MGGKSKRKKPAARLHVVEPTAEQLAAGAFDRLGMAYRRVPVIDLLFKAKRLTFAEWAALTYYRDQALRAEDDVAQHGTLSPERIMGGGCSMGGGVPAVLLFTPAIAETARIERDLGCLRDIARAVAVDDKSLSQWCIAKHGGRERYDGAGKFVALVPLGERRNVEFARLELKMAAHRIAR